MRRRPIGIFLLSLWLVGGGIFGLAKSLIVGYKIPLPFLVITNSIWLILSIILGIGLFCLKEWARIGVIILYFLSFLFGIIFSMMIPVEQWNQFTKELNFEISKFWIVILASIFHFALFLFIFFFLNRSSIKKIFN